jgi:hypothetical protein
MHERGPVTKVPKGLVKMVAALSIASGSVFFVTSGARAVAAPLSIDKVTVTKAFEPAATSLGVGSDGRHGPLVAFRNVPGVVWAKEGSLNSGWVFEQDHITSSFAVVSDPHNGPLIAVLDTTGTVWAKEGSLDAGWTEQLPGVQFVAVASDADKGPLIAVLDNTGTVWAKEGSLDAGWIFEKGHHRWR